MPLAAVLDCRAASGSHRIAALTVLDRLIVAAHRAGCGPIHVVSSEPLPDLARARAQSIAFHVHPSWPGNLQGPVLVAEAAVWVSTADLRRVLAQGARLATQQGDPLPLGVMDAAAVDGGDWRISLERLAAVRSEDGARRVTDAAGAREAERALWSSLGSAADGLVDRWFNRPAGRGLSRVLIHTAVTPNQVSVAATLMGLGAAGLFASGGYAAAIWGALLLQISAVVDCVDGELARVLFKESPLGKWLDIVGDQVVHVALFLGVGLGLWRAGNDAPVLWLAGSAAAGVVIAFLVVLRGLRQPEALRNRRLQRLIDATTNRDFSVLLLALALVDRVAWFLWMTAVGVHVFWVLALAVQLWNRPAEAVWEAGGETPT